VRSKLLVSMMLALAVPAMVHAAEPEDRALMKQCKSAKGEVKEECQKVAKQMIANPDGKGGQEEKPGWTQQDVTHSSPVMDPGTKPAPANSAPPKQADKTDTKPK
jgi:hypothetical protein